MIVFDVLVIVLSVVLLSYLLHCCVDVEVVSEVLRFERKTLVLWLRQIVLKWSPSAKRVQQ